MTNFWFPKTHGTERPIASRQTTMSSNTTVASTQNSYRRTSRAISHNWATRGMVSRPSSAKTET